MAVAGATPQDVGVELGKQVSTASERPKWGSRGQFIMVLMGYAIGLGNIWRFPYMCGKYGGGAFMIAYLVSLFCIAAPLFVFETVLGHKYQLGPVGTFTNMYAPWAGVAYVSIIMTCVILTYYQALLGWAVIYFVQSFAAKLPWHPDECGGCTTGDYFGQTVLNAASFGDEGGWDVQGKLFLALMAVWFVTWLALIGGKNVLGKIAYFTVLFPVLLLVIIFCKAVTLEGAGDGVAYYITPDMSHLTKANTWSAAASQILFSLSPAMGTAIAMSSYHEKSYDRLLQDNLVIICCNSCFSMFGGFAVFSIVGYLAEQRGLPVEQVASAGTGLAFDVFAEVLTLFPGGSSPFFSVCFFFMLLLLGLDSAFAFVETLQTYVVDFIQHKRPDLEITPKMNMMIVSALAFGLFLIGIVYTTRVGSNLLDIADHFCPTYCLLFVALVEYVLIAWKYGAEKMIQDIQNCAPPQWQQYIPVKAATIQMKYVGPVGISFILLMALIDEFSGDSLIANESGWKTYGGYPTGVTICLGWGSVAIPVGYFFFSVIRAHMTGVTTPEQPAVEDVKKANTSQTVSTKADENTTPPNEPSGSDQ
uniref:Transporter n=6 Tax=Oxyrrhis marina TaxID=2969 RepID=A0A7S4GP68_OXYMA|mmetsp:Transcript_38302/g.93812  ORF Transcript_38302/g.93812 Transcript_38302/m.93812 type:complete len:588 (+) Transcript_38302:58-1821(+)